MTLSLRETTGARQFVGHYARNIKIGKSPSRCARTPYAGVVGKLNAYAAALIQSLFPIHHQNGVEDKISVNREVNVGFK